MSSYIVERIIKRGTLGWALQDYLRAVQQRKSSYIIPAKRLPIATVAIYPGLNAIKIGSKRI